MVRCTSKMRYLLLFFVFFFVPLVKGLDLTDSSLVGYWPLTSNCSDMSTNSFDGTQNNGVLCGKNNTLRFGNENSTSFDGVNDFISFGDIQSKHWDAMTVQGWFWFGYNDTTNDGFMGKSSWTQKTGWFVFLYEDMIQHAIGKNMSNYEKYSTGLSEYKTALNGTWINLAITFNKSSNYYLYVNGELNRKATPPNKPIYDNSIQLVIGKWAYSESNQYSAFNTAHVAIWNRSLNPDEIYSNYKEHTKPLELKVDTDTFEKKIDMIYCSQSKEAAKLHHVNNTFQDNLRSLIMSYTRIWIQENYAVYMYNTIPLTDDCVHYNYTNLTTVVQDSINLGITPYLSFAHSPRCQRIIPSSRDGSAPKNYTEFGIYTKNVTATLKKYCYDGTIIGCNSSNNLHFDRWIFEIWNEPMATYWWGNDKNYSRLYKIVFHIIKEVAPNNRIAAAGAMGWQGGSNSALLNNLSQGEYPDIVGNHLYDNAQRYDPAHPGYENYTYNHLLRKVLTKYYYYTSNAKNVYTTLNSTIKYYNFEYNMDADWDPGVQLTKKQIGSTWYANVLWAEIFSGLDGECQFDVTHYFFGLWSPTNTKYPYYYTKYWWVRRFSNGTDVNREEMDFTTRAVTTKNSSVIMNNKNRTINLSLQFDNPDIKYVKNLSGSIFPIDSSGKINITLGGYGVSFITHGCMYGGKGTFSPNITEGCHKISTPVRLDRGEFVVTGTGKIQINSSISGFTKFKLNPSPGGKIDVHFTK